MTNEPIYSPNEPDPINQHIKPDTLRALRHHERGRFMAEYDYGDVWTQADKYGNTYYVPVFCPNYPLPPDARRITNVYYARWIAPRTLDCTRWSIHDTAQSAAENLLNTFPGEDYSDDYYDE